MIRCTSSQRSSAERIVEDWRLRGRDTHEEATGYRMQKVQRIIPHRKMKSIDVNRHSLLGKVNHHEFTSYFLFRPA